MPGAVPELEEGTMERLVEVTVRIPAGAKQEVERVAQEEHRTLAGQIRHWIATGLASQAPNERAA
jgi:hypothetical protein